MKNVVTPSAEQQPSRRAIESLIRTFDNFAESIAAVRAEIEDRALGGQVTAAARAVLACKGRLIVVGVGKSGHIGRKLAATFASTGTPAYFVHPTEASHGDLGMIGRDDLILALSWSGETAELANLLVYAKRFALPILAITSGATSALARTADVTLLLPKVAEACPNGLAPTTSTLLQLAIGDALAIAVLKARGFSAVDFRVFHPGGKLGAQLTVVREIMHQGERIPLLPLGTAMADAVVDMSAHGFGVVGIVDDAGLLVGVVTDGDLRRHMSSDLLDKRVDQVMTRNPKMIAGDMIAGEALDLMQGNQISVLFVTEERRPVGIVHIQDLLRIGVA